MLKAFKLKVLDGWMDGLAGFVGDKFCVESLVAFQALA